MKRIFDDIKVGESFSETRELTRSCIEKYADVSEDYNPVHLNPSYAKGYFGGGCIAHGLFGLGMISKIIGMKLPGEGTVFLNENINYLAPIYEGDLIKASVTIIEKYIEKKHILLKVECTNQNEEKNIEGTVLVKMMDNKDGELKLRKINEMDLEMIMNWRMSPEVTKYMYSDPVLTLEKQKEWYKKTSKNPNIMQWIINFDNKDIGLLSISDIDLKNKKCEWAYYIADTAFRGRGIAKTLECNVYDYVFYILGLNKLGCEVFVFNDSVVKLHEKFGSEVEGIRKEHIIKNGKKYDVVVMGMLKDKWEKTRTSFEYDVISIE